MEPVNSAPGYITTFLFCMQTHNVFFYVGVSDGVVIRESVVGQYVCSVVDQLQCQVHHGNGSSSHEAACLRGDVRKWERNLLGSSSRPQNASQYTHQHRPQHTAVNKLYTSCFNTKLRATRCSPEMLLH